MLIKLLKKKWLFYILVTLPLLNLGYLIIAGKLNLANPLESIFFYLGNSAVILLLITLWISPLQLLFPKITLFKVFNIHKRTLGVSSFFYALLHFSFYALNQGSLETILENFQKPYIVIGFLAFTILFILAASSFDWVIKKMTKRKWKKLHRLVYLTLILLFFHIMEKKGNDLKAVILIAPLALAELIRFSVFFKAKLKSKK